MILNMRNEEGNPHVHLYVIGYTFADTKTQFMPGY